MIIDFSVSNYKSICGQQSLNMTAAKVVSKFKEVDSQNTVVINDKLTLLKSKAIYGANASGKSNLIKALIAFTGLVDGSANQPDSLRIFVDRFLLTSEYDNKPSFFQLIFLIDGIKYRYGFEVTTEKVISEWLFGNPGKKEIKFFTRTENSIDINPRHFQEGVKIKELVKDNSLFLSSVNLFKALVSNKVVAYIKAILIVDGLDDSDILKLSTLYAENAQGRHRILKMLKVADIGIEGLENLNNYHQTGDQKKNNAGPNSDSGSFLASIHKRQDASLEQEVDQYFNFEFQESAGSQKLFHLSALILLALDQGRPLFIDEFDARFHPLLTKKLVQLFNSDINKNKTQFIVATHDTNLLSPDLLRKDQVCFVEKDRVGASHFYSLAEFKGVRNDSSIQKDYISGRFGAIPFLEDFTV